MKIKIKRKIRKGTSAKKIIEYLLTDRGITDKREFLHPRHPKYVSFAEFFGYSKKYKKNLDKTLKLLKNIRDRGEMVVVYTDYDADGLTGGAILWETLHKLGFKVMPYVPHRKREGYGFSRTGIDRVIKKYKPVLIISVDHGIVAHDEIEYASQKGIPIIVTDHHQKARTLPKAFAVFHTSELSGSGVAYFFAKEIFENFQLSRLPKTDYRDGGQETFRPKDDQPLADNSQLENHFSNDYLSLAAIGTIADLVRLTGHNRGIVEHGLSSFA
ncbi:MAG: DHH family phosphoesterase, partial [Candidatus Paceibacterota bacterium]